MSQNNNFDYSVWHFAAEGGALKDIPPHLFTEDLLKMKDKHGRDYLAKKDKQYVIDIIIKNSTENYLPSPKESFLKCQNKETIIT